VVEKHDKGRLAGPGKVQKKAQLLTSRTEPDLGEQKISVAMLAVGGGRSRAVDPCLRKRRGRMSKDLRSKSARRTLTSLTCGSRESNAKVLGQRNGGEREESEGNQPPPPHELDVQSEGGAPCK